MFLIAHIFFKLINVFNWHFFTLVSHNSEIGYNFCFVIINVIGDNVSEVISVIGDYNDNADVENYDDERDRDNDNIEIDRDNDDIEIDRDNDNIEIDRDNDNIEIDPDNDNIDIDRDNDNIEEEEYQAASGSEGSGSDWVEGGGGGGHRWRQEGQAGQEDQAHNLHD